MFTKNINHPGSIVLASCSVLAVALLPQPVAGCGSLPQCKTFREIYGGGKQVCENMWGDAFKYEPDEDKAFVMWWDTGSNPNAETTETLDSLSHLTAEHKDTCHLDYYHVDTPAPAELSECAPYKDNACCAAATVTNATKIKESYGSKYHWDRCGPLSPQCERYFVEEACFYECEPAAGHYRRFPATPGSTAVDEHTRSNFDAECDKYSEVYNATKECSHNSWELFQMPIKASYCDAWYEACADDLFCASEGGDFFSCAAEYEECDEGQGNHFAKDIPTTTAAAVPSGDGPEETAAAVRATSLVAVAIAAAAAAVVG